MLTIEEDGIRSTISIDQATLAPSAKNLQVHDEYAPKDPVDELYDKISAGEGQPAADEIADKLRDYAAERIVRHVGEGDNVRYVVK